MCFHVKKRLTFIIVLSILAFCLASENAFEDFEIKSENLNKRLVPYTFVEKTVGSHHDCVRECFHFGGECKAFNFNIKNKTCELKARGTSDIVDASEFEQAAGFIFTDVTEWPKTSLSACVNHNCLEGQTCFPLGNVAFKCVDKPNCGSPPVIDHGVVSALVTTDGAFATYSCIFGYEMASSFSAKKCEEGSWTSETIVCIAKDCGPLTDISHGTVTAAVTTHEGVATYSCNIGYRHVTGDSTRTCVDGTWSGIEPSCAIKDCGYVSSIWHGTLYAPVTTHGSTATYTCDNLYQVSMGNSVRTCYDGIWTGIEPTCSIIPHIGCYVEGYAYLYHGTHQYTWNDILCQRWDSQTPQDHGVTIDNMQYGDSLSDSENYCREPDGTGAPWCYTTDISVRWAFCGIEICP